MHDPLYHPLSLIYRSTLTTYPTRSYASILAHVPPPVCRTSGLLILLMLGLLTGTEVDAQAPVKPAKAAVYSIILPGLGHKYTNDGKWGKHAALYTITDVILVAGLITSEWQRRHLVQSYRTWAASYAGISNEGKNRRFYVTIGNHLSSDDYRDVQLRNRRVDLVSYVADPAFHWSWQEIEHLQKYRDIRRSAESWSQQRGGIIASLVANRMISAVSALLTARRKRESSLQIAITPGPFVQVAFTM